MATLTNPPQRSAIPDYITSDELSRKLRMDRSTIWRLRTRGVLPYVKIGQAVLFDPESVAAALEKFTVSGRN